MPIDVFLQQLVRQGYVDRFNLNDAKTTTGKRRGRVSATQGASISDENPQAHEWRWGNRAHSEVGEQAVAQFVAQFMVERTTMADVEEEDEDGAGGSGRRRGKQKQKDEGMEKRLETVLKAMERAAGGNLSDIK
jgi:melanoma-associated antigen